jgi:hypothetical protein
MKTMKNLSILMLCVTLFSCGSEPEHVNKNVVAESYITHDYEEIEYPVKLHFVEKSGMKLIIASSVSSYIVPAIMPHSYCGIIDFVTSLNK